MVEFPPPPPPFLRPRGSGRVMSRSLRSVLALGLAAAVAFVGPLGSLAAASAPGVPSAVTVGRADGTVTASWPSVAGAVGYHVTYTSDGGASWQLAALRHPSTVGTTAIAIGGADNSATYIVGVRARSADDLWGGWRNSPPAGPWVPPPPDAPASVSITRSAGALTASWPAAANAASYHVTYTADNAASWELAALAQPAVEGVNSITIAADNAATYIVGVRARNSSGGSSWVNSSPAGPFDPPALPPLAPQGLRAAPGNGQVRLFWNDPADVSITGYEYRMRYAGVAWSAWTPMAASGPSTVSHVVDGLGNGVEYRFKVRAVNPGGASPAVPMSSPWYVAAVPTDEATVTVANPLPGTATMTVTGHNGQWWFQAQGQIPPGAGGAGGASAASESTSTACLGPAEGGEAQITGLDPKADYVFGAYSDGACGAQIASASAQSSVGRPGYPFEQYYGRTDGTLPVLWQKSATSGVTYDVVYSSDGGVSWARAATGVTPPQCTKDQSGGHNWANSVCYTITGPVGGTGNQMDNTATYIVAVRAAKGGVSSWWRNSAPPIDPVPEPRVTAYPLACPGSTDYVLYMSWAKLPESGTGFEVRYKIGNGAWVNLPAEDSSTPDHRKVQGAAHSNSRWLEWMDQLPAQNTSYAVTAQVRRSKDFTNTQTLYSEWGEQTFNAGTSSDVKRRYTRCPDEPTEVSQSSAAGPSTTVTWTAVTGPHDYDIRYRISSTGTWAAAAIGHASTSYTVTGLDADETYDVEVRARVWDSAAASDWQRAAVDYDADDDNLIEISTLAQLNAIRWDTDGNGLVTGSNQSSYRLAFPNATAYTGTLAMGCTSSGCDGYELAADLDFDTDSSGAADSGDTYWNSGSGWNPIGGFNAELDGNNHTIENLFVNLVRTNSAIAGTAHAGLFSDLGSSAKVSDFSLDDVSVYGKASNLLNQGTSEDLWVGALAGKTASGAKVAGISVSGSVRAERDQLNDSYAFAGGLIGENKGNVSKAASSASVVAKMTGNTAGASAGGIAAHHSGGEIITSYFTGSVFADGGHNARAGGIAGIQNGGSIKAAYSQGAVTANAVHSGSSRYAGGIVGDLSSSGEVQAVYAAVGPVGGNVLNRGGIAGSSSGGTVTADSYYDNQTITGLAGGRGTGKTRSDLRNPSDYTGIYATWNLDLDGDGTDDDPWGFSSGAIYPVIKSARAQLAVSDVTGTTAKLTALNYVAAWWYKGDQENAACTGVGAGVEYGNVTSLTAGATYTYTIYSDSSCTSTLASPATFTTIGLSASAVTTTTATLTIVGHTGNWYVKETAPSTGTCSSAISGTTHALSTLTAGTTYTYKAYSDASCTTEIASVTFTTTA